MPCNDAGLYPGLSNIMAARMTEDLNLGLEEGEEPDKPSSIKYAYFTAGSGGVGTTILVSSILP